MADNSSGDDYHWTPTADIISASNIQWLMDDAGLSSYSELHRWSVENPAVFWGRVVSRLNIQFSRECDAVLDTSRGVEDPDWFKGAELNIVQSCFAGDPDAVAIHYRSESGDDRILTLGELEALVGRVLGCLKELGVQPGDAVALMSAMTIENVAAFLATVAMGAVAVPIADSFSPDEVAVRLDIANAKLMICQQGYRRGSKWIDLYAKVKEATAPACIVVTDAEQPCELRDGDVIWDEVLPDACELEYVASSPGTTATILFSSGTTGSPKAIPWTQLTPLRCAMDAHFHHDIHPGNVLCWPTNMGWMMGPWLVYASLLNRASMALYGGLPHAAEFGQFVEDKGVTMLGSVPSLISAWLAEDKMSGSDWSGIRCFSSTGECSSPADMARLMKLAGDKPVIEYCGGTEIGGGYITGTLVQDAWPGTFSTAALGTDFVLLGEDQQACDDGEVFIIPPSMGLSQTLLNRDHHEVYHDGVPAGPDGQVLRRHGDHIRRLENGYFRAQGRVDDGMNLGGIKVSSTQIEELVCEVEGVREAAAVAVPPPGGGPSQLVMFLVTTGDVDESDLHKTVQGCIRQKLNPLFKVERVVCVESLPRTASNKVMRRKLREMVGE